METRSPLPTDVYQLNMIEGYLANGETGAAVFDFSVRPFLSEIKGCARGMV